MPEQLDVMWLSGIEMEHRKTPYRGIACVVEITVMDESNVAGRLCIELLPGEGPRYRSDGLDGAQAAFDQPLKETVDMLEGRSDPTLAFMQGTLKVRGATRPLYELFRYFAWQREREG